MKNLYTSSAVETFFDLIGLDFAKEGSKAMQFDYKFETLGVELDLGSAVEGVTPNCLKAFFKS